MTGEDIKAMMVAIADAMDENRDALCALDGEIGDADHGIAMASGFGAVRRAVTSMAGGSPAEVLNAAARAFLSEVGASSGPLYATAFMRAAAAVKGKDFLTDEDVPVIVAAMAEGIKHRGKASPGDKTMLDAWLPAAEAAARAHGSSAAVVLAEAAKAAEEGAEATADMEAKLGRASRLGSRSVGHKDPGATSAAILLRAMTSAASAS